MNLAYISYSAIPSSSANSVHVMKMCEALTQIGVSVTLLVPDLGPVRDDVFHVYGVTRRFPIQYVNIDLGSSKRTKNYLFAWRSLRIARRRRCDLVITRSAIVSLLAVLSRRRHILELHDVLSMTSKFVETMFRRMRLYRSPNLVHLVVISGPLRTHYIEQGAPEEKVLVCPDAVNISLFPEAMIACNSVRNIGYTGSLYKGRGIEIILGMAKKDKEGNYHIYGGETEQVRELREQTKDLGNITFYGHVPNKEIPTILGKMDVLLMPYQERIEVRGGTGDTSRWMSPMKMFEYLAAGRAVISSDIAVLREVLTDGNNALLVDPCDVDQWLRALHRLRTDQALWNNLAENARTTAKEYTWTKRAERILADVADVTGVAPSTRVNHGSERMDR